MESASLLAVRQAVAWANEQGMTIRYQLSEEQLERLGRVFSGQEPWSFELYRPLEALGHALPRLAAPDLPARVHFADCLSALEQVLPRSDRDWSLDHALTPEAFTVLGYAATSAGISDLRAKHRSGWQEHADKNRAFLLRGALGASETTTAVVIGAGKLYDIPLKQLCEGFERVMLVDVDGAALAESVEQVLGSRPERERVELVTADVTGIGAGFVRELDGVLQGGGDESETLQALVALLQSFRLSPSPSLVPSLPSEAALFSVMLLSQLAEPMTRLLEVSYAKRFPSSVLLREKALQVALAQFTHRVQHQHVQALLRGSAPITITSDASEHQVVLRAGQLEGDSHTYPLLGAPHLLELFPASLVSRIQDAAWPWLRLVPTAKSPRGRLLQVQGCVVAPG